MSTVPPLPSSSTPVSPPSQALPLPVPVIGYATPLSLSNQGAWVDGAVLVMHKQAPLPDVCIKCGQAGETRLRRKLYWHEPWLYILILFPGILIYAIVALCIRQTADLRVPMCRACRSRRRWWIGINWLVALVGIGTMLAPAFLGRSWQDATPWFVLGGLALLLVGLIAGIAGSQVVHPKRMDPQFVWLKGACPEFLASFPAVR